MTDKPFDLTPFVKSFDLKAESSFRPVTTDGEDLHFHEYKAPTIDITMTFEYDSIATAKTIPFADPVAMKMTQRGKYWFDVSFEADVVMQNITLNPDGGYDAEYVGTNFIDLTDRRLIARFLRWVLRR